MKQVELKSAPRTSRGFVPQLRVDDILGGTYCPTDGFVDPHSVMMGFMLKARERGVRLWLDTQVTGIETELANSGSAGVSASIWDRGRLARNELRSASLEPADLSSHRRCSHIAWLRFDARRGKRRWTLGGPVAHMAGVELPVEPLRRQLVPTEPFDQLPKRFPMVIDMSTGFHFRREGKGILLAWNDPEETPGFKTDFDPTFVEKILTRAADRVPCLVDAAVNPRRAWAGLYEMTPDHHAIIGPAPKCEGFIFRQWLQRPRRDALPGLRANYC